MRLNQTGSDYTESDVADQAEAAPPIGSAIDPAHPADDSATVMATDIAVDMAVTSAVDGSGPPHPQAEDQAATGQPGQPVAAQSSTTAPPPTVTGSPAASTAGDIVTYCDGNRWRNRIVGGDTLPDEFISRRRAIDFGNYLAHQYQVAQYVLYARPGLTAPAPIHTDPQGEAS